MTTHVDRFISYRDAKGKYHHIAVEIETLTGLHADLLKLVSESADKGDFKAVYIWATALAKVAVELDALEE